MIDAVCRTQGVEFFRGMLMTRVDARENLAAAVARLAEASIRVADLSHFQVEVPGLRFVSLFDDTMDVWTTEDFKLLEPLSDLAMWSRPDEFERILRPAA